MPESDPRPMLQGGAFPSTKENFWSFVGKVYYVAIAIVGALLALLSDNPWFGLAVALAFIFGPKVWRNL